LNANVDLTFGQFMAWGIAYLKGEIDEVRIWNVTRTQDQIRANMYRPLSEDDREGIAGYWTFDETEGQALDYSGNGNHGTLHRNTERVGSTAMLPEWVTDVSPLEGTLTSGENVNVQMTITAPVSYEYGSIIVPIISSSTVASKVLVPVMYLPDTITLQSLWKKQETADPANPNRSQCPNFDANHDGALTNADKVTVDGHDYWVDVCSGLHWEARADVGAENDRIYVPFSTAQQTCQDLGMRLPTVRELTTLFDYVRTDEFRMSFPEQLRLEPNDWFKGTSSYHANIAGWKADKGIGGAVTTWPAQYSFRCIKEYTPATVIEIYLHDNGTACPNLVAQDDGSYLDQCTGLTWAGADSVSGQMGWPDSDAACGMEGYVRPSVMQLTSIKQYGTSYFPETTLPGIQSDDSYGYWTTTPSLSQADYHFTIGFFTPSGSLDEANCGNGASCTTPRPDNLQRYLLRCVKGITVVTSGCDIVTDGLVACYPFDGNANDESGNEHDGTVNGATLTVDQFGNPNSAYSFDGDDSIRVIESSAFDLSDFTYSAWINANSSNGWRSIVNIDNDKQLLALYEGQYAISGRCGTHYHDQVTEGWHHVVWIVSGEQYTLYVDDNIIGTNNTCSSNVDASNFMIGSGWHSPGGNEYFDGKIDNVRVYNRALSKCEIQSLYTGEDKCYPPRCSDDPATYSNETRQAILPCVEIPLYTDINGSPINITGLYSVVLEIPFGFSNFEAKELTFLEIIDESNPIHARFNPDSGILDIPRIDVPTTVPLLVDGTIPGPVLQCSAKLQQSALRAEVLMLQDFDCNLP
jgi:hypothetical protein